MRVVRQCHRFSKEVEDAPLMGTLKVRLDRALRCPCSLQGGWIRQPSKGPFQLDLFYHSSISLQREEV